MRDINMIVIHCSATTAKQSQIGVKEIDKWHRQRGFFEIGYHFVIKRSGEIQKGRDIEKIGAHAKGYNETSIGICLVGGIDKRGNPENNFTVAQFDALNALLHELIEQYPDIKVILGHRDLPLVNKACPSFDVSEWLHTVYLDQYAFKKEEDHEPESESQSPQPA